MYLERVDIVGFRGINRISLSLDDNTVLIGENAWGKSSLLDALTLLLSPEPQLYHFTVQDFYYPAGDEAAKERHLQVIFTFCEKDIGHWHSPRYRHLAPLWIKNDDGLHRIYYRVEGELADDGTVCTWRTFLDLDGQPLSLHDIEKLARGVIRIHPVLRLRDARFMRRLRSSAESSHAPDKVALNQQLDQLSRELVRNPQKLTNSELRQGLEAMRQLLEHYFAESGSQSAGLRNHRYRPQPEREAWLALDNINRIVAEPNSRSMRLILLGMFSTLLQAKGPLSLDPHARPLLLVEDPETRLHPIMLSVAWGLLSQLPLQRITTTNSGELVSLVPIESICRLVRESSKVATYRIGPRGMSPEDSRRIAFHIRFNRPSALFARCWLLVEGETEIWLLNEFARQCGYHFEAEGVKVIEFAQSGLRPLLKFANRMGIQWHVLTDGDDAGKKYAATVRNMADNGRDHERDRLTILPAPDMEHFLYRAGFDDVYHRISAIPANAKMQPRRVIEKAIHRTSKPDLAIEVASQAKERGVESVPPLLKKMFSRVVWLARGRAD
ncbi:ATP-dependent endonuclease [Yersinia intermedia]|jgi:putative ATP-dependent endonuclease of OLD family|uniref:ATP-dependent endonuclease n=1 Tax=Yersinia intermedia TaxID=631 RepID=A0A208ZW31_YERIN|nr:ATP-dependent endonuclease [Yersinia intermedia]MCB5314028.1 ATP-dependent endonuclease [Yersinia intermedia]MCB5322945.1 ATP-dependent endonuclease [Yersinia intermedia]MCB5327915.1 ATP-dependent endonuclease [Yersinia intermedia]OVZ84685.1 ATP-dependent endonuclease [Yersinia intermedia]UNK24919.1 ATP-dependent endonuclease [Yersinia intermedia]